MSSSYLVSLPNLGRAPDENHRQRRATRLARAVGVPVKVHWSRAEEFESGYVRPMAVIDIRAALGEDDSIDAWELVDINAGAAGIAFPYRYRNRRLAYQPADSPLAQGPYRALGATANHLARESHIDDLAHTAGIDPLDFRLRHLEDERLARVVSEAAGRFGWDGRTCRSIGLATGLEKGAGWPPAPRWRWALRGG